MTMAMVMTTTMELTMMISKQELKQIILEELSKKRKIERLEWVNKFEYWISYSKWHFD